MGESDAASERRREEANEDDKEECSLSSEEAHELCDIQYWKGMGRERLCKPEFCLA